MELFDFEESFPHYDEHESGIFLGQPSLFIDLDDQLFIQPQAHPSGLPSIIGDSHPLSAPPHGSDNSNLIHAENLIISETNESTRLEEGSHQSDNPARRPPKLQAYRNMLTFFKKAHRQYLQGYIRDHPELRWVLAHKQVVRIFYGAKKHISMYDYACLYRIRELRMCWRTMLLQRRYLYHFLVAGKPQLHNKIAYLAKIGRFEKAFLEGKFDYIS